MPLKVIQEQLGHSTLAIAADTYSHVSDELQREAVELVAEMRRG